MSAFRVDCRDCDAEGVHSKALAHELAEGHSDRLDHRVVVEEADS